MSDWNRYGRDDEQRRYGSDDRDRRSFGPGETYGQAGDGRNDERRSFGDRDRTGGAWTAGESSRTYGHGAGYGQAHRREYERTGGYGAGGRANGQPDYGRSAYGPSGPYGRPDYNRPDYAAPDETQRAYGRGEARHGHAGIFGGDEELERLSDGDADFRMFGGRGEHRGRGPKNYVRSDDRIREDVSDRLSDDSWLDASEVEVQVQDAEVTLTGTVANRHDKRRAEDLAEQASGVRHVQNNLRVQASAQSAGQEARTGIRPGAAPQTGPPAGRA
jgi:hypothetical protein